MQSFQLTGSLTIQSIAEVYAHSTGAMNEWLVHGVEVDASQLEVIDTAGVQFILAIKQRIAQTDQPFVFKSNELVDAAIHRLGLSEQLSVIKET